MIAADASFGAKPCLAVDAVSHDAYIDQMRIRPHEGIDTGVLSTLIQDAGAHISTGFCVKGELEMVFLVMYNITHR